MHILIIGALLLMVVFGPQWWAKHILRQHTHSRADFPGTGGQFARHLLDQFQMDSVKIESTEQGDHYDPLAKAVRLTPDILNGKSLTAVTVAAHEVGHAIQDHLGYAPLHWRTRLVRLAQTAEKTGSGVLLVMPFVALLTRSPAAGGVMFLVGLCSMAIGTIVHLVTLPVEWDASFGRALPLMQAGRYLNKSDEQAARRILQACALTYLAASLASLLNVWRWLRLWRR
jgi:Zn-dependent membrane protease YugP